MTKFVKMQQRAKKAYERRGKVIWVSCYYDEYGIKHMAQGTYRRGA